jgi:hypothetical protein
MAANAQALNFLDVLVAIQNDDPTEAIMAGFRTVTPAEQVRLAETAVAWDRFELVQAILAFRPEIADSTELNYDDTLLITAIVEGASDMAVYLVSKTSPQTLLHVVPLHPADPVTTDGATALHLAVARIMPDVVRAIVEKNYKTLLVTDNRSGIRPIDLANEIPDPQQRQEIIDILTAPTKERGRELQKVALLGEGKQLPHLVESMIGAYASGIDGYLNQQREKLRREMGIQEPPQRRRDIGGRKRKARKTRRRTTSSRRRRTLSRARLASS